MPQWSEDRWLWLCVGIAIFIGVRNVSNGLKEVVELTTVTKDETAPTRAFRIGKDTEDGTRPVRNQSEPARKSGETDGHFFSPFSPQTEHAPHPDPIAKLRDPPERLQDPRDTRLLRAQHPHAHQHRSVLQRSGGSSKRPARVPVHIRAQVAPARDPEERRTRFQPASDANQKSESESPRRTVVFADDHDERWKPR